MPSKGHQHLVNGVFKGGGAKGVVYAGALEALESRNVWFQAVAGTSAGAITASLIAAGLDARDLRAHVPSLLGSLRKQPLRLVLGLSDSWFDNRGLAGALEEIFRQQCRTPAEAGPVTYRMLFDATGITLYVVAFDLAEAQPVVFSVHTSPDASVTSTVLASTAIPGVFPSARLVLRTSPSAVIHRLVDGGAWANYPRFVFSDPSFRAWVESGAGISLAAEHERTTLGFALADHVTDSPNVPLGVIRRDKDPAEFDLGTLMSAGDPRSWSLGMAFSSRVLRLLLLLTLASLTYLVLQAMPSLLRDGWHYVAYDSSGLLPIALFTVSAVAVVAAIVLVLIFLALLALGQPLGDVLIPAAKGALSVGAKVPPWLGRSSGEHVVILPVGTLETTTFKPLQGDVEAAIDRACWVTEQYLAVHSSTLGLPIRTGGTLCEPNIDSDTAPAVTRAPDGYLQAMFTAALGGLLVATLLAAADGSWLVALITVAVSLFVGYEAAKHAAAAHRLIAEGRPPGTPERLRATGRVLAGMGAAFVLLGVLLAHGVQERIQSQISEVRITSASLAGPRPADRPPLYWGSYEYTFTPALEAGDSFADDRTLRLGQRTFVGTSKTPAGEFVRRRHVGAADFMWSLIVGLPGLMMMVAGVRRVRVARRQLLLTEQFPLGASARHR